ncbi:uncharacterized protein LOC116852202 [Odontomachus brunneus]|uniref:uncharacterized protein LOC116852202 n=1 Tax=Odontomachus brunneus TaxID=486640 RepID=UPI0013F27D1B|nr:uncharacterized protein LOC116852202 [Odontomachus brunneus]
MQRVVCSYSQQAATTVGNEDNSVDDKMSSFDKMINIITTNQMFRTAMQGTAVQEAAEAGRAGRNCLKSYQHCGFSIETILSLLSSIIAATNTRVAMPTGISSL